MKLPFSGLLKKQDDDRIELPSELPDLPAREEFALPPLNMAAEPAPARVTKRREAKTRNVDRPRAPARAGYEVLRHPDELHLATARKLLLCGHSVFATLDARRSSPGDFIEQAPRSTVGGWRALVGRRAAPLRIFVDPSLVQRPKTRYALALDGYLTWGRRNGAGSTVLLGGCEQDGTTYLEIYVFREKMLVEVFERVLPSAAGPGFDLNLTTLLDELVSRYPNARIFSAAPLPEWNRPGVQYIGDKAIKGLNFSPLSAKGAIGLNMRPAIAVAAVGAAAYAALLGAGWVAYDRAGQLYEREAASPELTKAGGINNARLDAMQQQRLFMEAERPQVALARQSKRIVEGIASIPGVRIAQIDFGSAPSAAMAPAAGADVTAPIAGAAPEPDVTMQLVVPAQPVTAMEQAKALLSVVGDRTRMTLRLKHGGWSEDAAAGTRKLEIEGFLQ